MPTYGADDLRQDATRNIDEGHRLQERHQADTTGCCKTCGRVAPCGEQQRGEQLVAYHEPYTTGLISLAPPMEAKG